MDRYALAMSFIDEIDAALADEVIPPIQPEPEWQPTPWYEIDPAILAYDALFERRREEMIERAAASERVRAAMEHMYDIASRAR